MAENTRHNTNIVRADDNCDFALAESQRCLKCKAPTCIGGCPVGWNIPEFLRLVSAGDFTSATLTVGHLFGEVCGYVCARDKQCKGHCVLAKKGCGIDVGAVERQAFSVAFPRVTQQDNALQGVSVAVVGGGVSGVTFAVKCVQHGADVTLFEQKQLLNTLKSIPEMRLPRAALERIEHAVNASSVKIVQRKVDEKTLAELQKNYDVVYLATGAMKPNLLGIDGEQFVTQADGFLRGNNFAPALIIGGGNTAMDCAMLNASKGHDTVVCYRRARNDMPAFDAEVSLAEQCGASFVFNAAPMSVVKNVDGTLTVTFAKTQCEGRGKLVITDETFELQCNLLVAATGSIFDASVFTADRFLRTDEHNCVCGNLYSGGDATGKGLAVLAVADALNAFRAVLQKYKR